MCMKTFERVLLCLFSPCLMCLFYNRHTTRTTFSVVLCCVSECPWSYDYVSQVLKLLVVVLFRPYNSRRNCSLFWRILILQRHTTKRLSSGFKHNQGFYYTSKNHAIIRLKQDISLEELNKNNSNRFIL